MKIFYIIIFLFICATSNAQYTQLCDFAGTTNGSYPYGDLFYDGTFLYSMTEKGGTNDQGVIFKIKPDGTGYSKLFDFSGTTNGSYPTGSLISDGNFLFAMTDSGGINNMGTIFKIKPDGTGYSKLFDFSGVTNGSYPYGKLFYDGTFLYGMTSHGGTNNYGVIFKIMPDGTGYVKLLDFKGTSNGLMPLGSLFSDGTFLYGMTYAGGTYVYGTLFKIKPDGSGYFKLYEFGRGMEETEPMGSLISDGTFLYGMTNRGSQSGCGTIFKIKPDGSMFTVIHDFTGDGCSPWGSLIYDGSFLYGMTAQGGSGNYCGGACGVIFKMKSDGTGYVKFYDFTHDGIHGWAPLGSLISNGTFLYGMTQRGGVNDDGIIFKINPTGMGITESSTMMDFTIYPTPFSLQTTLKTDQFLKAATLSVYNSFGQMVKQIINITGNTVTLYRDNLPRGLYFLRLTQDNKIFLKDKVIITD